MNRNYQGGDVGASDPPAGSVKRARERVQAGLPRESLPLRQLPTNPEPSRVDYPTSTSRLPQAVAPGPARLTKSRPQQAGDGRAGRNISRPMHAPQWPLPGPAASPLSPGESEPVYTPSARAPRRPPRPSNVPSILDESEAREPAPPLTARSNPPESPDVASDGSYDVLSPAVASSRQTTSSIGTIPDFPVPAPAPAPASASGAAAKKSSTLGPPPSARRGASSFYSTASFVSPIPEESPRSRSHGSYASSAAMPEAWDRISPISGSPPYGDAFFDDSITDKESTYDEFGDESKLVRSASIGKKGKPALVMNRTGSGRKLGDARPAPSPVQPFNGGTGYVDASTSSSKSFPTAKPSPDTTPATTNQTALGPDATPVAIGIASSGFGDAADATDPSRPPNRLSNMRRPPRLDIDAVRAAEARGSLTSLPDLIRRATRLASMIDKGKRPGSRMDDLTFFGEKGPMRNGEGSLSADERHHSGLSDMLAAFPPPVHTPRGNRQSNASWFRPSSWPAVGDQGARGHSRMSSIGGNDGAKKQRRRCCGLPLWAFILVIFLLLCLVVAAIVVPLEFFVFKNLGNHGDDKDSLANCQSSLTCLNGGTNVVSQGVCSCICTNGFTGSNCGQSGSMGCTTTNLVATDGSASINNVTLGRAIPRLISQGDANFSLPLSGTIVLAKVNTANLSCIAQNALVTFDGWSTRGGEAKDEVTDASGKAARALANRDENFPPVSIITFVPRATSAVLTGGHVDTQPTPVPDSTSGPPVQIIVDTSSYGPPAGSKPTTASTTTEAGTGSSASGTGSPTPTPTGLFTVTEEVVDFGRVAMLYILQEESVNAAETAQTELQALFSRASKSKTQLGVQVTEQEARKVIVGGDNTINLVDFTVDVGKGPVGRKNIKRSVEPAAGALPPGPG